MSGGLAVQPSALPRGDEVLQPEVGDESGQDDGERRGEAFEDVVGVLDDRRDDQTAQRLEKNDRQAGRQAGNGWMRKRKDGEKKKFKGGGISSPTSAEGELIRETTSLIHSCKQRRYLQDHHCPGDGAVSLQHAGLPHLLPVVQQHPEGAEHQAEHTWRHRNMHPRLDFHDPSSPVLVFTTDTSTINAEMIDSKEWKGV